VKFLDEASRIYDQERGRDRLTTVAATSIMSMTWTTLGKDRIGSSLQRDSAGMAQRLHLYDCDRIVDGVELDSQNEEIQKAASAAAWGSFNFQM
jgi:hypothetical protein